MKTGRVKAFIIKFKSRFTENESRRASILLGIQIVLLPLLSATAALVVIINSSDRRVLYFAIVIGLLALMAASLAFNLRGKYMVSAWLTTIAMQMGPWGSILLDNAVIKGDFVPLIYIALSIQLCSVLLSEKATLIIALIQLFSLAVLILSSPNLMAFNWPSLVVFVLFTSVLGIVSSFLSRRQMEQLEIHEKELQNDKILLRDLSVRDSLTGLFNRRYMEETLEREISRAIQRHHSLGIIMADVDHFKKINDTFGHAVGDDVLCDVADILGNSVRTSDVACRLGGDEFVLILPECSLIQIRERVETIRAIMKNGVFRYGKVDVGRVALSFGIAAVPENGSRGEEVLKVADDALYAAKEEGRKSANAEKSER
jgi:diguanylate cyclase (GGDEF)-like protein